jgi:hypothetical protein
LDPKGPTSFAAFFNSQTVKSILASKSNLV